MRRWILNAFLLAAAIFGAACANVEVDSSESGDHALAAAKTCHVPANFPVSDGSKPPSERFQRKTAEAIEAALSAKGYEIVNQSEAADIVLRGAWERGKVLADQQTLNYNNNRTQTRTRNGEYLTLTALVHGEEQWTAQAPILLAPDDIDALLKSFPARGDS